MTPARAGFSWAAVGQGLPYLLEGAGLTILISMRLVNSSVGRAFLAVREDQVAAEAMGVDATKYKVKAFIIGSLEIPMSPPKA